MRRIRVRVRQRIWGEGEMKFKARFFAFFFMAGVVGVFGSSTTLDGRVTAIEQNRLSIKAEYQPYSSPGVLCVLGKGGSKNLTFKGGKDEMKSLFIDDVPVTPEEFRAVVKVGTRVFTHENRSHFFWVIASVRDQDNLIGEVVSYKEGTLRLRRPTMEKGQHENACGEAPPYLFKNVKVTVDAKMNKGGKNLPISKTLKAGQWVLVKSPRKRMRVEVIPQKFNDYHEKVTTNDRFLGNRMHIYGTFPGIFMSGVKEGQYNIGGYHFYGKPKEPFKEPPPDSQAVKIQNHTGAKVYRFAGLGINQDIIDKPVRPAGDNWWTIDGYWTSTEWKNIVKPGRWFMGRTTRGRSVLSPSISSEDPVVWGTIEKVEGNKVTLSRPSLEGMLEPKVTFDIDADANYFRLGVTTTKAATIKPGNFIRIYKKRPQTIMINDGMHVPEGIDPDRKPSDIRSLNENLLLRRPEDFSKRVKTYGLNGRLLENDGLLRINPAFTQKTDLLSTTK